ncbi:MAG: metalloregulator ArsR/SmtB family transcription factor [Ectothiorhodospiraceae bacterium]|jgi:DNA-binding transcriptional ArsR family regulator
MLDHAARQQKLAAPKATSDSAAAANALVEALDSRFFKALSEPTRVEILKFLVQNGKADIGEITAAGRTHRSVVSRHLAIMHDAGILTRVQEGRHVYYDVNAREFIQRLEAITDNARSAAMACCPWACT